MGMWTWRRLIEEERKEVGDTSEIIACTLDDAGLDREFNNGYGGTAGVPFTAWSERRVYFPATYDGMEWVASAPRDPCDEATQHVGGQ